jgi:teichuronic acid biosynthesis glycosyltransferase TuaC
MEKTKILMLMSIYQKISGHTRVVDNLSKFLVKEGFDVTIGAIKFQKEPPNGVKREDLKLTNIISKIKNYDIIHNHQTKMNYFSLFTEKPFIFQYHGASMKLQKINLFLSLMLCQKKISKLVSVSKAALLQLPKFAENIPTEVIYNGIDSEYYKLKNNFEQKKSEPQLFFAGNLFQYKNVQFIIRSLNKLKEHYPNFVLRIAGDGEYKIKLEEIIKEQKLEKNVFLLGRIDDEFLRKEYCSSDVYISASTFETFGMPLLESMSCFKPVVVSKIPPHEELVNGSRAGECFSMDNDEIIEKIIKVYENKEELGILGRKFAEKYDWIEIVKMYKTLYNELT